MMAKKRNKSLVLTLACMLAVGAVAGCKKDQGAPAPTPQNPAPVVQPKPAVQPVVSSAKKGLPTLGQNSSVKKMSNVVVIDFTNRKDPFKPGIVEMTQVTKTTAPNLNLIPIQRYEVEKFKITGIIAGLKENRALLVDPDGKAYVARTGMLIGPNNGKIVRITANSVEVDESFKDDTGRLRKRVVKLALQRKK